MSLITERTVEVIKKLVKPHYILEKIARDIVAGFPLSLRYRLYGRTFCYWAAFLKESEHWDRERLETFQFEQLKALLVHAGRNVPYYEQIFSDCGFNPEKVQCLDDLKTLPYLTKDTIRDRAEDLIAGNVPKASLLKTITSGSTGIPVAIYRTRESEEQHLAHRADIMSRIGFNPKKRIVYLMWRAITMSNRRFDYLQYGNQLEISSACISDEWMQKYFDVIRRFNPEFIWGTRTTLLALALSMKERKLLPPSGLKAVFAVAETVYPWQKEMIEEIFGVRAFLYYGMYEGVVLGGGCEHSDQYHISPHYGITEFISVSGNDLSPIPLRTQADSLAPASRPRWPRRKEEGARGKVERQFSNESSMEIVGTGFRNYAMPLIRYRTGDIATSGPHGCRLCNRKFQLIEQIEGRLNEFLITKDGRISMPNFTSAMFRNVKQFQFYQDEPGLACLRIVKGREYSDADTSMIKGELDKRFHVPESGLRIDLTAVDEIKKTRSGKTLMTEQRLDLRKFMPLE